MKSLIIKTGNWYSDKKQDAVFNKTDRHCPKCGRKGVWKREKIVDLEMGCDYQCIICYNNFYLNCEDENRQLGDAIANKIMEGFKL